MATIIRIKRRRCEDPFDNLVASCKRRKNDQDCDGASAQNKTETSADLQSCLKFAGTVNSVKDGISLKIKEAIKKEKITRDYKQHHVDITSKTRQWKKKATKDDRFRVVSLFRCPQLDELDKEKEKQEDSSSGKDPADNTDVKTSKDATKQPDKVFQLYDVELLSKQGPTYESVMKESQSSSGITCNSVPMVKEHVPSAENHMDDYVYDLYYTNNRDFSLQALESSLSIQEFTYNSFYTREHDSDNEDVYEDEDDSNDEGNWRNDYPDEDPHFYENQDAEYYYGDDVREEQAFDHDNRLSEWMDSRCNIEDENELSSEDEDLVYFGESLQTRNDNHGYRDYYRRVTREMNGYTEDTGGDLNVDDAD